MARLARIVVPGLPHHVTQRGNGRAKVFFSDADYACYRDLLVEHCRGAQVSIWGWCLMPNHVHLILTPSDPDGLRRAETIGRPLGNDSFLTAITATIGRAVKPGRCGRKRKLEISAPSP